MWNFFTNGFLGNRRKSVELCVDETLLICSHKIYRRTNHMQSKSFWKKVKILEPLLWLGAPLGSSSSLMHPSGHWPQANSYVVADLPSKASSLQREHAGKECSPTENCCLWWPLWAKLYTYTTWSSFSSRFPCGLWKRFKFPFSQLCAANSGGGSLISEVGWHSPNNVHF